MGGYSYPTQISKIFACGGPKIVFLVFLKLKIFRLRRAKNHVLCVFRVIIFPPAAGIQKTVSKYFYERRNALLLFVKRFSSRPGAVPGVFASVNLGTRFYYSQK